MADLDVALFEGFQHGGRGMQQQESGIEPGARPAQQPGRFRPVAVALA